MPLRGKRAAAEAQIIRPTTHDSTNTYWLNAALTYLRRPRMTAIFRVALLTVFAAASIPAVAAAQGTPTDSLNRRVVLLERKVASLEQRVRELEARIPVEQPPSRGVPASPNSRDVANWRRLQRGMTTDAVRAILGEPESVIVTDDITLWYYPDHANVSFSSGKVDGWSEPAR
jgi:hypothetical protein